MSRETITARSPGHDSPLRLLCADADNAPTAFYYEFSESATMHHITRSAGFLKVWKSL